MTSAIFKSTGAIIVYSIISIGLLAIAGYNFWGWFGGSDSWKAKNPDTGRRGNTGGSTERGVCWCDGEATDWPFNNCWRCGKGGSVRTSGQDVDHELVVEDESANARMVGNGTNVQWNYE